jgi:hypothetical protein
MYEPPLPGVRSNAFALLSNTGFGGVIKLLKVSCFGANSYQKAVFERLPSLWVALPLPLTLSFIPLFK